jgi:pimeloyl-ACP methyl ester carboxylesterase
MRPLVTSTSCGQVHALVGGTPDRGDLVVVPGLGVSVYLRESVAHAAACGYRAWLPDPPGFGDSGNPPRRLGIREIADVLLQWLQHRDLSDITLVGHSCGTQVAAHMAADAPELVARLILGSPTVDPKYKPWPKAVLQWRRDGADPGARMAASGTVAAAAAGSFGVRRRSRSHCPPSALPDHGRPW